MYMVGVKGEPMSVLIKDMGKPKSCYAITDGEAEFCPFVNTDDDCVLLSKKRHMRGYMGNAVQ